MSRRGKLLMHAETLPGGRLRVTWHHDGEQTPAFEPADVRALASAEPPDMRRRARGFGSQPRLL